MAKKTHKRAISIKRAKRKAKQREQRKKKNQRKQRPGLSDQDLLQGMMLALADSAMPIPDTFPTLHDKLATHGLKPTPPEELPSELVSVHLWELINKLADLGHYLSMTDHLSDRELYDKLYNETLYDRVPPEDCVSQICMIGAKYKDQMCLQRYYTSHPFYSSFLLDQPGIGPVPREPAPYDRDQHLPTYGATSHRVRAA